MGERGKPLDGSVRTWVAMNGCAPPLVELFEYDFGFGEAGAGEGIDKGIDQVKGDCRGTGTDMKPDECSGVWGVEVVGVGVEVGANSWVWAEASHD